MHDYSFYTRNSKQHASLTHGNVKNLSIPTSTGSIPRNSILQISMHFCELLSDAALAVAWCNLF